MSNPFATAGKVAAPAAPTAAPAAAPVAPAAPTAVAAAPLATVEKKPRKKPNRQMTSAERKYVIENYASRSTSDIAEELKLTRQQVYRTVHETRTKAKERIAALQAEAATPERDAKIAKLEGILAALPEKPFGGGQGGGAKKGSAVDNVLDDLLA